MRQQKTLHTMRGMRLAIAASGLPLEGVKARRLRVIPQAKLLVTAERNLAGRVFELIPAAALAWEKMRMAAQQDGIEIYLVSAFRSFERQLELVQLKRQRGQSFDEIFSVMAPPGYSEHHSGRAVDIGTSGTPPLEIDFEVTTAFTWLCNHARRFGFRLSYPRGNDAGYQYEPWHWYYVGRLRLSDTA